ncbi:MAG: B12-binding domain-containing protein [Bacilli bacterium]
MNQYYEQLLAFLDKEDKDQALMFVLSLLNDQKVTIEQLYENILGPTLWNFHCQEPDQKVCIWKEHTRTSIIRTILEATYSQIIQRKQERPAINKKIVVFTPSEEFHEIGAIMAANYFALAGYQSQYIGANTPKHDVISAVSVFQPDYVAISVTNYYNLVVTKQITKTIREQFPNVKIIVGGQAFSQKDALEQVDHDFYLSSPSSVFELAKGDVK